MSRRLICAFLLLQLVSALPALSLPRTSPTLGSAPVDDEDSAPADENSTASTGGAEDSKYVLPTIWTNPNLTREELLAHRDAAVARFHLGEVMYLCQEKKLNLGAEHFGYLALLKCIYFLPNTTRTCGLIPCQLAYEHEEAATGSGALDDFLSTLPKVLKPEVFRINTFFSWGVHNFSHIFRPVRTRRSEGSPLFTAGPDLAQSEANLMDDTLHRALPQQQPQSLGRQQHGQPVTKTTRTTTEPLRPPPTGDRSLGKP